MTVSWWRASASGDGAGTPREADVVVVGAGIAGTSAALHLERRGLSVIRLERGAGLAAGASSKNAGFLMRGAADNYLVAARAWGRERARLVWRWTEENLEGLRSEGVDALEGTRRVPSCLLGLEPGELGELRQSASMMAEDGFEVGWLEPGAPGWDDTVGRSGLALGALVNPADGSCNPVRVVEHLASRLRGPLVPFADVIALRGARGGLGAEVVTARGVFAARRVLLCTNAYAGQLVPGMSLRVAPRRGQMLAVRREGARLDRSYYANRGFEYFRQHADGVVVFGGCRRRHAEVEVGCEDRTTIAVQSDLQAFAERVLGAGPGELDVVARWAGVMGFTEDGLPLIGPVSGAWPAGSVWFCGGCTGHGMSLFYRTARAAVEAMVEGVESPFPLARAAGSAW